MFVYYLLRWNLLWIMALKIETTKNNSNFKYTKMFLLRYDRMWCKLNLFILTSSIIYTSILFMKSSTVILSTLEVGENEKLQPPNVYHTNKNYKKWKARKNINVEYTQSMCILFWKGNQNRILIFLCYTNEPTTTFLFAKKFSSYKEDQMKWFLNLNWHVFIHC